MGSEIGTASGRKRYQRQEARTSQVSSRVTTRGSSPNSIVSRPGVSALTDNGLNDANIKRFERIDPVSRSTKDPNSLVAVRTVAEEDPRPLGPEVEQRTEATLPVL
jgi:hypothetical protein